MGGDFYDALPPLDGRLVVFIGNRSAGIRRSSCQSSALVSGLAGRTSGWLERAVEVNLQCALGEHGAEAADVGRPSSPGTPGTTRPIPPERHPLPVRHPATLTVARIRSDRPPSTLTYMTVIGGRPACRAG